MSLAESGVVRRDIDDRASGTPLRWRRECPTGLHRLALLDVAGGSGPLAGAAVYLWHCDREGRYSMYEAEVASENYLRGVRPPTTRVASSSTRSSPAPTRGRWPHMHFEIYENLDAATAAGTKLRTSQLAIPRDVCEHVYATAGYEQSVANLSQTSLESDGVFADGYRSQLASWTGLPGSGRRRARPLNVGGVS